MKNIVKNNIENLKKETLKYYSKELYKELEKVIEKDNNFKDPISLINILFDEFQSKLDKNTKFHNSKYEKLENLILSWREKQKRKLVIELKTNYTGDLPIEAIEGLI